MPATIQQSGNVSSGHKLGPTEGNFCTRRQVLRVLSGMAFGFPGLVKPLQATPLRSAPRVVSLDTCLTQIALSVGVTPIGIPGPTNYRRSVIEPVLPNDVIDIGGSVEEPNLELLRALKPDLILLNEGIRANSGDVLSLVAPLFAPTRGFQRLQEDPFIASVREHESTSEALGRVHVGESYRTGVTARIDDLNARARASAARPILMLWGIDRRHAYVLVRNSIFQGVLDRLGLVNAWQGVPMPLGMSVVGLEQIAPFEDAIIAVIDSNGNLPEIMASPLWNAMRPVRQGRIVSLPAMWSVGGLPVADRFARYLVPALERLRGGHG